MRPLDRFQPPSWSGSLAPDPNAPEGPLSMRYRLLAAKLDDLARDHEFGAEWFAAWSEIETIKNKCGGMPPKWNE